MARKKEIPIVEEMRDYAHNMGVLDQTRKDMLEGHVEQVERNITKSMEELRGEK
ncbi:hypothetical protein ACFLXA_01580 [Chloroflexota bacterium]